ncbi:transposase [Saccharopolyspora pogona]|uniref:transposase n=1 Tax=Saccharopolyspora pogona TaxID=333966 RepID=UPI0021DF523B|nr:transposase [Saccharopolyspora pogona]
MRRSWASIGQTPALEHRFNWKRASMAAALCYPPSPDDRRKPEVAFHVQPDAYNTETLIGVLTELRAFLAPDPVTLVWDGLPARRSRAMIDFLATQADWLTVERLPGYAPDLNPVEALWSSVKGVELADLCPDTIDEAITLAQRGIDRIRTSNAGDLWIGWEGAYLPSDRMQGSKHGRRWRVGREGTTRCPA